MLYWEEESEEDSEEEEYYDNPRREPKKWYFSYGSNTQAQMRERTGNHTLIPKKALIRGWDRVFRGWSNKWGGGTNYLSQSWSRVTTLGAAYKLTEAEFKKLDRYEGVRMRPPKYERYEADIEVRFPSEWRKVDAILYNNLDIVETPPATQPSLAYLKATVKTLNEVGWKKRKPDGQLRRLRVSDIDPHNN